MRSVAIVLLCIAASIAYGIVHDQVTARICVEYFTIGHPNLFGTGNPTLLGLGWGVVATWWVGVMLGVPLAVAARAGTLPKMDARDLARPLARLLLVTGGCAILAGLAGWVAADRGWVWLAGPMASEVPADRHAAFLTDLWAHNASYACGTFGGLVLIAWTRRRRRLLARPGRARSLGLRASR